MSIVIYTDGACLNNGKKNSMGGYGVFFGDNDIRNKSMKLTGNKITNQVAELTAILCAIEIVMTENIIIKTDSMYCINCITKWAPNWKKNGWVRGTGMIENLELIKQLYEYTIEFDIKYVHIRAHTKEPHKDSASYNDWYGNMQADMLASAGALDN